MEVVRNNTNNANPSLNPNFAVPLNPAGFIQANVVPPNYSGMPNYDPRALKRREIGEVVRYHRQAISNSRDLKLAPEDIRIANLDADEKIFLYIRRHWSENISWISRNLIYALLPFSLIPIMNFLKIRDIEFVTFKEMFIILVVYYSVIVTNVVKDFFDWYFDPYIITNDRIIHYEFKPFSRYVVQETMLQSIQKIEEKAGGILSNVFGYGTLMVYIEGPNEQFTFKNIPQPTRVRNMISDLAKVSKKYGNS